MMGIVLNLKKSFLDIRFRNKILLVYILLLIIPLLITSMIFYGYSSGLVKKQTEDMIANSLKKSAMHTGSMLKEIESLGNVFYLNSNIQSMLVRKNNMNYDDLKEYEYIYGALYQISLNQHVHGVKLYIPDWKYYAGERYKVFPYSEIENDPAVKAIMEQKKINGWWGVYEIRDINEIPNRIFSYVVFIVDLNNVYKTVGALRIDILEGTLSETIGAIGIEGKGMWGVAGKDGQLVTSFGSGGFERKDSVLDTGVNEITEKRIGGNKYTIFRESFENDEWSLIYALPSLELSGGITKVRLFTILIILFLFILFLTCAAVISDRMTANITGLSNRMKEIQSELKGKGNESIAYASKDEIGMLNQSFDLMVDRLRKLFIENYKAQLEKKEARLKLLQAQINPHFLYNVLDQINWMAIRAKEPEISEIATNLGKFYNISLSKGKDIISLREELEHIGLYISLQKYRLGDTIKFTFELDESIMEIKITKLSLQPLVENAIVHGILETEEQTGEIIIKTARLEDYAQILVSDSAGMLKPDRSKPIISGADGIIEKGYGLKNVDERLKLYFGDRWGLDCYLDEAGWTVFKISMPLT